MEREYLLIRGRINRAGDYVPRRAGSTRTVRRWPMAEDGDVVVETVAEDGVVLRTERAQLRNERVCAPGPDSWRVRAYVPLDEDARRVRVRQGERVVWEAAIPPEPRVAIALETPPTRASGKRSTARRGQSDESAADEGTPGFPGGRPAVVAVEASDPAEPALASLTLVYQWGERRFRTVYIGPASRRVRIPADAMPGGRECRLVAIYSNGVRSATAATAAFPLDPIGPVLRIDRPAEGETFTYGVPVPLEGFVQDPEWPSSPRDERRLTWLVDGTSIGTGPLSTAMTLPVGEHVVTLAYAGDDRQGTDAAASRSVRITVAASDVPPANDWPEWDPFAQL